MTRVPLYQICKRCGDKILNNETEDLEMCYGCMFLNKEDPKLKRLTGSDIAKMHQAYSLSNNKRVFNSSELRMLSEYK